MKLVGKIKCSSSFKKVLEKDGYIVFDDICQGLAFVDLRLLRPGHDGDPKDYVIPPFVNPEYLRIYLEEYRLYGSNKNSETQIVCGISGKALWPNEVREGIREHNALFLVPKQAVTVLSTYQKNIIINVHTILVDGQIARVEKQKIWEGRLRNFPDDWKRYRPAAEAARAKSQCRFCSHVHFGMMTANPR